MTMMVGSLPHRERFSIQGTYLNSAYTHPMSIASAVAVRRYVDQRMERGSEPGYDMVQDRQIARELFARLVNCDVDELAWVPSTMVGENLITAGLRLVETRAHVITDTAHFEGSQYLYQQLRSQGVEVTVIPLRGNKIALDQIEREMRPNTKLIALSLVSALNGYQHNLRAVCELAHSRDVMVYADLIQAAGAIPVDVRGSGVDFCACSTYKWLMGDFGVGFLYVRRDRLDRLRPQQYGYRQLTAFKNHVLPFEDEADEPFSFVRGEGAGSLFEVGTLSNAAVAALRVSLEYLLDTGVDAIQAYRRPMVLRLQEALPGLGYMALTDIESTGPIVTFAKQGAAALRPSLDAAGVNIQIYPNRIRISPSVFNTTDEIDFLIDLLTEV